MNAVAADRSTHEYRRVETPHDATDEQLLIGYRTTGDPLQFEQLVLRYEHRLYNYLRRYLGNPELAQDVFQATFLKLHLKCEQFQEGRKVRPWLYRIATNQAVDALRRERRRKTFSLYAMRTHTDGSSSNWLECISGSDPNPLETLVHQEQKSGCLQAVEQLPGPFKQVVNLVLFEGLKYREVAEVLSIPLGTVKSRMHTAFLRLQKVLGESE